MILLSKLNKAEPVFLHESSEDADSVPDVENKNYIFRSSMTVNGVKIYARHYGKKAFKIEIK